MLFLAYLFVGTWGWSLMYYENIYGRYATSLHEGCVVLTTRPAEPSDTGLGRERRRIPAQGTLVWNSAAKARTRGRDIHGPQAV